MDLHITDSDGLVVKILVDLAGDDEPPWFVEVDTEPTDGDNVLYGGFLVGAPRGAFDRVSHLVLALTDELDEIGTAERVSIPLGNVGTVTVPC